MTQIKPAQHAAPYGAARDLPFYQELARQIQGGKLLTRFIARNQRSGFLEIERQLDHLVAVVDRFYGPVPGTGHSTNCFPSRTLRRSSTRLPPSKRLNRDLSRYIEMRKS